ncbi:MAG: NAD+ synthase [Phycisphaerales bacterium]|nr:NAD+ synthase [Phycisphaerales bacterium]
MRIALAQVDPTIGDLHANTALIVEAIRRARTEHADLVVFPELTIPGYPPKDLLLREGFVAQCMARAQEIAAACTDITAVVGLPRAATDDDPRPNGRGRGVFNSLAVCRDGVIESWYDKRLLPTYDVFDEDRYFDSGSATVVIDVAERRVGLTICEDLWRAQDVNIRHAYPTDPVADLAAQHCDLVVNPSASPFFLGKPARHRALLADAARRCGAPVAHVNQIGGQDELIFAGNSCVSSAQGELIACAKGFESDLLLFDLDASPIAPPDTPDELQLFRALTLGVRDYCGKCRFQSAVIGLSGGIDSAIVAVIAAAAIGGENILGVSMPSRYSSQGSRDDAADLAERLGLKYLTVAIEDMHLAVETAVWPHFQGLAPDETEENVQSRLRGLTLMAFSNKHGSLLLTTGNKSEMAVGYCTLYGDMAGGLAVLSDVPKTWVYRLCRWINDHHAACGFAQPPIPESTISKPPSAELKPDQKDTDSLPPYEILDEIIARYVELEQSASRIIEETGFDPAIVQRFTTMIDRNEYKRKQAPIGLKVTSKAFGFGRRFPIVQNYNPNPHDSTPQPTQP